MCLLLTLRSCDSEVLQSTRPRRSALLAMESVSRFYNTSRGHSQASDHLLHRRAWWCTQASNTGRPVSAYFASRGRDFCLERSRVHVSKAETQFNPALGSRHRSRCSSRSRHHPPRHSRRLGTTASNGTFPRISSLHTLVQACRAHEN